MPKSLALGSPACAPETVAECLLVLREAFPTCQLSPQASWHFLQDLTDEQLREATVLTILHLAEVYPSTGWIGVLRQARQQWCERCGGTGEVVSETGYEVRCGCRV